MTLLCLLFLHLLTQAYSLENSYHVGSLKQGNKDGFPCITASASYQGHDKFYLKETSTIAKTLNITVIHESDQEFTVNITRGEKPPRFTVPHESPFSHTKTKPEDVVDPEYQVHIGKEPFILSVERKSTQETIFDTSAFDFVFSEFYLTFGVQLPTRYMYGMGERRSKFLFETGLYTIWQTETPFRLDFGEGGAQTYGAHPVYLVKEKSGNWHIVYLRTTYPLDFQFDSSAETLKFLIAGGHIELKFFLGDQYPDTAIKLYHNYLNKWIMMPFWAYGYHQCRWGYIYLTELFTVLDKMEENDLPIDVIWSDIEYMKDFGTFSIDDGDRYSVEGIRNLTQRSRWVCIVDPGIPVIANATSYIKGTEYNVWVRSPNRGGSYLTGVLWAGYVHWPDWLNPNASKYWYEMLADLYSRVPYSGIWLDMNENSNFCLGEYPNDCRNVTSYLPDSKALTAMNTFVEEEITPPMADPLPDSWEFKTLSSDSLPYLPGNKPLETHGFSLNAWHYGNVINFDFHELDSFYIIRYTYLALQKIKSDRPFVFTRSTYPGSGQFAMHWSGSNAGTWDHLRISVSEIFNFQIFGTPMMGADVCGYGYDVTEEICARWNQLGAFYPFMRNHNVFWGPSQEPYVLGPTVLESARTSLHLRYSLVKFYYSVFIRNNGTGTAFRPVFFDFPGDNYLMDLQSQFLIGSELMVVAVFEEGKIKSPAHFPAGVRWYNFFNGKLMLEKNAKALTTVVDTPLNTTLPVFIKGGAIVHTQDTKGLRSTKNLTNVFNLVVALTPTTEDSSIAFGQMMGITDYQDDKSVDKCLGVNDCMINIAASAVTVGTGKIEVSLTFSPNVPESLLEEIKISEVTFYGIRNRVGSAEDSYCNWADSVIKCIYGNPKIVAFETVNYIIDQGKCIL